jgi:hypothetical protein
LFVHVQVWTSSSDSKRVVDAAATATAKADWEAKKAAAEAKGETFTETAPEEVCACSAPPALRLVPRAFADSRTACDAPPLRVPRR